MLSPLVYGSFPRLGLPTDKPSPSIYQRTNKLQKATEAMTTHFAKSQVSAAVRTSNGPDSSYIHNAATGSHVIVYILEIDNCDGPFSLLALDGETCKVMLLPPSRPKKFRTTVVKRFIVDVDETSNDTRKNHIHTNTTE